AGLLGFQVIAFWVETATLKRYAGALPASPLAPVPSKLHQLVAQHFLVLFLLTAALTATALGEEKAKGTLADLFTTALTTAEIVAGKLLARSLRALAIPIAGLPILCAVGTYAGVPPLFFVALLIISVFVVLGLGAIGMTAAVTCKSTSAAVLVT